MTYPLSGPPIANGTQLILNRTLPLTQQTTILNQGNFYPQAVEIALDTIEMELQQVANRTGQFRGTWATGVAYNVGDIVIDGANGLDTLNYYMAIVSNTSGTWSTDLTNGLWVLFIDIVAIDVAVAAAEAAAATATTEAGIATTQAGIATTQAGIATTEAGIATTQAGIATTQATNASNSASAAATSAAQAADYAASYSGTSTTSLAIATGSQTFTTQANKLWVTGQFLQIASNANSANYMNGYVTSYSGTTLVMDITNTGGSGTYADWNISISGTQGPTGPGGGSAFNAITSGTNTTAAMVVGTGSSLAASGSGTIAATTATTLATGRTVSITGDMAYTSGSFNGSANVTGAGTLATVNSNVGSFTNANVTVDGKGRVTAAASGSAGLNGLTRAFSNLKIITTSNTASTITANQLVLSNGTTSYIANTVSVSYSTAASGANGLDTGTLADSTWYAEFVIYNGTTVASLISLSPTSPTLPSGYTFFTRVGWIRIDGSGNILWKVQYARDASYVIGTNPTTSIVIATNAAGGGSQSSPTWVAQAWANFAPASASAIRIQMGQNAGAGAATLMAAPNSSYSGIGTFTPPPLTTANSSGTTLGTSGELVLESSNIYLWNGGGSNGTFWALGWTDNL